MSLSKKDPSLRVAANDPHLVSLGGGRLSTAVTIHNIPVGDCTIGSSPQCSVSLSGTGVKPIHCTIYRSEENQVTLVPEREARILIDGQLVKTEVDLRQGAMITIGDSYYLRYNNPAEALQMRSAMGDATGDEYVNDLDYFYETNINPALKNRLKNDFDLGYKENINNHLNPLDFMGWQCPKVFTADLVTVNMPAKDVLGQKYANFAKNLAENHRKDKNVNVHNTSEHIYNNIPLNNNSLTGQTEPKELTAKINNTSTPQRQTDMHTTLERRSLDKDHLEDMLKICSEYTDRQDRSYGKGSGSLTSSPIVQNRIKTNGSLPRDKKSPFFQDQPIGSPSQNSSSNNSLSQSPGLNNKSSGYENVRLLSQNRVEIISSGKSSSGYENVKLVPQSPRTKIRTNCMSPKKDPNTNNSIFTLDSSRTTLTSPQTNYEDLIKTFEEKFQKEIEAIEESSANKSLTSPLTKRTNKNINNLTIDIKSFVSPYNSPKLSKKPTPAPRNLNNSSKTINTTGGSLSNLPTTTQGQHDKLQHEREELLQRIQTLKLELSALQQQDNEFLIEMDMENALVLAELQSLMGHKQKLQEEYKLLQQKIHRLEAQHNATRVMEENQQAKLKHNIEMKQDQVEKLKELLQQKPNNVCLKEELNHVKDSLENDKKSFEDLEFQYLEGESEWHSYQEDLQAKEAELKQQLENCQRSIDNLETADKRSPNSNNEQHRRLSNHLVSLIRDLQQCEQQFNYLEKKLSLKIHSNSSLSEQEDEFVNTKGSLGTITQSLFGSTEMLCPKSNNEDLMSKSVNENMFYNNKIEFPQQATTLNKTNNSKEANSKLHEAIKEIERQRQLLNTQQGERNLDYEKRKIQELIEKLNSTQIKQSDRNEYEVNNISNPSSAECEDELITCQSPLTLRAKAANLYGQSTSPLSVTTSESSSKLSPSCKHKLSASSPESPKSFTLDDKRSSSVLSNDNSSQGDSSSFSCDRKKLLTKHQRPLTRYLPIFNEDLDLKRHIESAGHPITLCPHIFLDSYSCRGYLHKLGSTFHTWSKRWFVLDRQRSALIYYADKTERKPRGGAYFSSIDEVYMDHLNASKSSRPHSTFIVKTKKRSYYLQAASDTAARIWIDAIITGAQGNIDY